MTPSLRTWMVECYTPGIDRAEVESSARRAAATAAELSGAGSPVEYRGAILVPSDEVVFHLFSSPSEAFVREASRRAEVPFERVLESIAVDEK